MAEHKIDVPGDDNVTMAVGDKLKITFKEARRFCSSASTGYFDEALPDGDQEKDYVWTGIAQEAGDNNTVQHHAVEKGKECGSNLKRSATRSIQIGSQPPPE